MKTSDRLATILFLLAAPAARFLELKNNYDPAGLPTGGFPYLPAVLAAAAVVFLLSARGLPARDAVTADFGGIFRFDGQLTLTAAVLGGFLLLAAAALRLVSGGMAGLELILSVFLACSGAALLYALIAQRRSGAFAPTALLVPVCFLVGPVADELVGARQRVEQCRFTAVGVARKGNSDLLFHIMLLPVQALEPICKNL